MSSYAKGKEPVCPLGLQGCHGVIKHRSARSCASCAVRSRQGNLSVTASVVPPTPAQQVTEDREKARLRNELSLYKKRYDEALRTIESQEQTIAAIETLDTSVDTYTIEPRAGSKTAEATPVIVASDWHIEERVGAEVGGLNKFNIDIATQRATTFFQSALRLVNLLGQDVKIENVVLALLGDFITNDIHGAENAELNEMQPIHAIVRAQNMLASGIEFLLANSNYTFTIPTHSGNHSRTTQTTRFSSESGHSLEYLMYLHLAAYFRNEPRVKFIVTESPHSYVKVYDTTIRFQHGHMVKYGGGVGGIYIPLNKAVAQWNKGRHADLDVLGHFHQLRDGGNFIVNGSLIGYNGFALSIKADYEPPKQALFLIDKKRGRTCTWPILLNQ